jgi:hypothetical protein
MRTAAAAVKFNDARDITEARPSSSVSMEYLNYLDALNRNTAPPLECQAQKLIVISRFRAS